MLRAGHGIALIALALLSIGVVMVNSAGLVVVRADGDVASLGAMEVLLGRTTGIAAMAVLLLIAGSRLPVMAAWRARGLASPAPWIILGSIALLLAVHVPGLGREVNHARRWVGIGPVGFQPSELVKWGLPIVIALHCARRTDAMGRLGRGFLVPMTIVGVLCALIAAEDLGTAVLVAAVATIMLLAGGARLSHMLLPIPFAIGGFVAALQLSPYRIDRLRAFLDPYADPQGIGYHVIQSMAAVSGGGLAGRGLGNGLQKFGYLPEDTTDFIFAIICEELGIVGAAIVIALYAAFTLCGLAVIERARHPFERLLALGIVLTVALQALINLLVVTGLAPTKGIALPLVSSGGTGWCLTALAIGVLISIDRRSAREEELSSEPAACEAPVAASPGLLGAAAPDEATLLAPPGS